MIDGGTDWLVHAFGKDVEAFIYCQQRLNKAEHQRASNPRAISAHSPEWPAERWRAGEGYDTPLYSLTSVWSGYLSVLLHPLPSPSPKIDIPPGTPEAIRRC